MVAPHRCRSEGWTRSELPGPRASTTPDSATNLRQIIRPFTTLGLQLEEAKDLLSTMQDTLAVQNRDDTSALVRSRIADRARVNSSGANSLPAGSYPNV